MKSFREGVGGFAEPSAIAGRDCIDGDPMVAWVARATIEREEYELDEETDDPEDPPRPNTFLARAVEATEEEEGEHGDVGHPHSSQFRAETEDEVDLLGDLRMERCMPSRGEANLDDDVEFQRLMLGPIARSQSKREAPAIASSQPRRKGSHTQSVAPSQAAKGKVLVTSQPAKGKDKGQACGPAKGIIIREPLAPAQKKKSWFSWGSKKGKKMVAPIEDPLDIADLETLDPNAEETPSKDSPRLPSSHSHDSLTIGSPSGSVGEGDGDGGGGEMVFMAEKCHGDQCTQDGDHGAPIQYNRRQKFVKGGRVEGSLVDSDSYNTMISDFERMSTHESVGSYGGHSYQAESSDIGYSSGYATTGYPAPYFYPPPFVLVHVPIHVPVQIYAPLEMYKWRV
ncbi:hypothetical protein Taro_028673 [Colocasia esculenta]|uniref:Uncharacterized protein n=1 Tax=Colocasia esculenta TaxID=4460 RepID=A0A843VH13_COLES|nr:hypothetical protein [Colocasia esculenta]